MRENEFGPVEKVYNFYLYYDILNFLYSLYFWILLRLTLVPSHSLSFLTAWLQHFLSSSSAARLSSPRLFPCFPPFLCSLQMPRARLRQPGPHQREVRHAPQRLWVSAGGPQTEGGPLERDALQLEGLQDRGAHLPHPRLWWLRTR